MGYRELTGYTVEITGDGTAGGRLVVTDDHQNMGGILHGGAIATLCDSVMGRAVRTQVDTEMRTATATMTITYLASAVPGDVVLADASVVKAGRTTVVVEAAHRGGALATLAQAGLRTMLFLGAPREHELAAAGPLDALGIAGIARSLPPQDMRDELAPVARFLATLAAPLLHYKCCSTFDSAPDVGNLALAAALLRPLASNRLVPILGGQPSLGRYCAFGQLFAAAGQGGEVVRIDRHRRVLVGLPGARDSDRVETEIRARPHADVEDDDLEVALEIRLHERIDAVTVADKNGEAQLFDLV